jgi:hypothetical protein
MLCSNRNSSVGIATGYGLEDLGSFPSRGKVLFSSHRSVVNTASYPTGIGVSIPWDKLAGA